MSGSPKYQAVRSGEQRRQRAEQERKERERRRREEERKRKEEALRRAVVAATDRVSEAGNRLEALRKEAVAAGLEGRLDALVRELATTRRSVASADTEKALRKAGAGIDRADRGLADLRFQLNQHKQQQAADRFALVVDLLCTVPADVRARFDRSGHDKVDEQLTRVRRQVASDPAGATKRADALSTLVREHLDRVLARRSEHEARVANATSIVDDIGDRLAVLEAETAQLRVPLPAGQAARQALAGLQDALRRGDLDAVHAGAAPARERVADAERELDGLIDRIVERRQVLESIISALPDTGFQVDQGSFHEAADGALELRAYSNSGQAFAVLVRDNAEAQTEVLYTTDAMDGEVAAGSAGRSCGPLLEIIDRLSDEARSDGFVPGAVRWDDDPHRPPPGGRVQRPSTSSSTRRAS